MSSISIWDFHDFGFHFFDSRGFGDKAVRSTRICRG